MVQNDGRPARPIGDGVRRVVDRHLRFAGELKPVTPTRFADVELPVADVVGAGVVTKDEQIRARTAGKRVVTWAVEEHVIAFAGEQEIVAATAEDRVGPGPAVQGVVALIAEHDIGAKAGIDDIVAGCERQGVVAEGTEALAYRHAAVA